MGRKGNAKDAARGAGLAFVLLAVLTAFVLCGVLYSRNSASGAQTAGQNTEAAEEHNGHGSLTADGEIVFPVILNDGRLQAESVFPYSGINPDAGFREDSDAAAVTVRNISDSYLKEAEIRILLADGTERFFKIRELPAGKAAMAFSAEDQKLSESDICVGIDAEAVFEKPEYAAGVSYAVDGITITLQNVSDTDLTEIDVYCRDVFVDTYFGGAAYKYTIENLPAGESTAIAAAECILGAAEVVRIAVNEQK